MDYQPAAPLPKPLLKQALWETWRVWKRPDRCRSTNFRTAS